MKIMAKANDILFEISCIDKIEDEFFATLYDEGICIDDPEFEAFVSIRVLPNRYFEYYTWEIKDWLVFDDIKKWASQVVEPFRYIDINDGNDVLIARIDAELTQAQLAKMSGLSERTIRNAENRNEMSFKTQRRLQIFFDRFFDTGIFAAGANM